MSKSLAYYTPEYLANLLVSLIPIKRVEDILDLCVGSGNLLWAARCRWPSASLVGVDIDRGAVKSCRERFEPPATFLQADAKLMHPNMSGKPRQLNNKTFDIVLANPPFAVNRDTLTPVMNGGHVAGQSNSQTLPEKWESLSRRVEAMLLVYNLLYVRPGGYLAAIVPDSILSCDRFAPLRKWLIGQSQRLLVVKLPRNSFSQTEVAASAVILKRVERSTPEFFRPFILQETRYGRNKLSRKILYRGAIKSSYNRLDSAAVPNSGSASRIVRLADLTSSIKRGTFISKERLGVKGSHRYIHSTNIKKHGLDIMTTPKYIVGEFTTSEVLTKCGDILLVRVGKTLGRLGIVSRREQNCYISSCLYLIRPEGINSYALALLLQSRSAQTYYHKVARGSAAKFLTYADVQATPVNPITDGFLTQIGERYREILLSSSEGNKKNDKAHQIQLLLKELDTKLDALNINKIPPKTGYDAVVFGPVV